MEREARNKQRSFSIELKSRVNLRNMTLTNRSSDSVSIDGTLGDLKSAEFAEGIILEIVCTHGVLRVDIGEDEIKKSQPNSEEVE